MDARLVTYWIIAQEDEGPLLSTLGVILGPYVDDEFTDCTITDFPKLDPYWGSFIWGPMKADVDRPV
jgi:hypothetical protein